MGKRTSVPAPEMLDVPTTHHYQELMERSESARSRGDHWRAQMYATAAHKWAMDERSRLQRLAVARESLSRAKKRLEPTEEDLDRVTAAELRERHPDYRAAITAWEKADQTVRELEAPLPDQVTSR